MGRGPRYHAQGGDVPRDIDVLVVGDADDDLFDGVRAAEHVLEREVNIRWDPCRRGMCPTPIRSSRRCDRIHWSDWRCRHEVGTWAQR
jgi:hypothetical protein